MVQRLCRNHISHRYTMANPHGHRTPHGYPSSYGEHAPRYGPEPPVRSPFAPVSARRGTMPPPSSTSRAADRTHDPFRARPRPMTTPNSRHWNMTPATWAAILTDRTVNREESRMLRHFLDTYPEVLAAMNAKVGLQTELDPDTGSTIPSEVYFAGKLPRSREMPFDRRYLTGSPRLYEFKDLENYFTGRQFPDEGWIRRPRLPLQRQSLVERDPAPVVGGRQRGRSTGRKSPGDRLTRAREPATQRLGSANTALVPP